MEALRWDKEGLKGEACNQEWVEREGERLSFRFLIFLLGFRWLLLLCGESDVAMFHSDLRQNRYKFDSREHINEISGKFRIHKAEYANVCYVYTLTSKSCPLSERHPRVLGQPCYASTGF